MASLKVIHQKKTRLLDANGYRKDVQELITALGSRITEQTNSNVEKSSSAQSLTGADEVDLHVKRRSLIVIALIDRLFQRSTTTRKRAMTETANVLRSQIGHKRTLTETDALQDMIREMVTTERTYVKRLKILKQVH